MWAAMILLLYYQGAFRPRAVPPLKELVKQAQTAEAKAGKDPVKLKDAARAYEAVAGVKLYRRSQEAADCLLRAAVIYDTKLKDENRAVNTYKRIKKDYPPEKYEAAGVARTRLNAIEVAIDRRHSKDIGYKAIDWLVAMTGRNRHYSYALALFIITVVFKLITTPLSHAQYKSMKEMQRVQPLMKQLQEKYKDNQQELGKKMMELYKQHGVNPLSSCLPLLVQLPILMLLYYKLILPYLHQLGKGDFLWIGSFLAHRFPGIVAPNLSEPDIPLVIIYTISMIVSQKLSIVDPSQAEQQKLMMYAMPIAFAVLFRTFPSALMLYWLLFNIISTIQQYHILRQPAGPDPHVPGSGAAVGPEQPPRRPAAIPGRRSRRRRRRFEALRRPRPIWQPIPGPDCAR
jgi:YidC/Oxa1 family membrane protein insertase